MRYKSDVIYKRISLVLTFLCLGIIALFSYCLFQVNIIPAKYLVLGYGLLSLILIPSIFCSFKLRKAFRDISLIVMTIIFLTFSLATCYLNNIYNLFNNTLAKYETISFSIIVSKESTYKDIQELANKKIAYLDDNYKTTIKVNLLEEVSYIESLTTSFDILSKQLTNSEVDAIVLETSYLTLIYDESKEFSDTTKVIHGFEVKVRVHQEKSDIDVMQEPFILYISGIDKYGNINSVRGRSDVNILAVVNPNTHHILLVNTPRDYYVQLAGTTGYKDKLTHAGIYGIDKSINTLENLYGVDINYYLRVNFDTLIEIVDLIGGIDIYSDSAYRGNSKLKVVKGINHFDGKQALAFARERKAHADGDNQRGANQQQVITAIVEKVSNSSALINRYSSILETLEGSFQTDISTDLITSYVKYQLDQMPKWTIESIAVTGSDSMGYTYSVGTNYKLYIMIPDYSSVENAKQQITKVLNEKKTSDQ